MQEPLFEFSGACAGCGETPYIKLVTQLFGDRMIVANATGCSSIYGGNLPTTPWTQNADGRGPAWSNSLFEDNAEFGLGYRLSIDKQRDFAGELLKKLAGTVGDDLAHAILTAAQKDEADIFEQRERVAALKEKLRGVDSPDARQLLSVADMLVKKSVWIIGGDGWAYDIGFGGLDHVLASGRDVNVLLLDTEVYSNTGGQTSKSTPRGAVAKFAAGGKPSPKKDLGLIAMSYGTVYVASVAHGREGRAHAARLPRSRGLSGPVADHRLQPLHRARHQHDHGDAEPEGRRRVRPVAAVSLQPRARRSTARTRCSWIRRRRRSRWAATCTWRTASRCSPRASPRTPSGCSRRRKHDVDARWKLYEHLAARKGDDLVSVRRTRRICEIRSRLRFMRRSSTWI